LATCLAPEDQSETRFAFERLLLHYPRLLTTKHPPSLAPGDGLGAESRHSGLDGSRTRCDINAKAAQCIASSGFVSLA